MQPEYESILNFWFREIDPKQWWKKDADFDDRIRTHFGGVHKRAVAGELWLWRDTPSGWLAEIIVLDQFSRNMYRDTPQAFAADPQALTLAQEAVALRLDSFLSEVERVFMYLPYMHSESALVHQEAVKLFEALGIKENLDFEYRHKAIIDRFGRYPHRNAILGRHSTPEEDAFLSEPGSSF